MSNREIGYIGEETAAEYLRSKGYDILEQNYTIRGGEIDIIAVDGDTLVFVEVKCRTQRMGVERPAEAVDSRKTAFLVRCAERYVFEKSDIAGEMPVRFDCIEIYFQDRLQFTVSEINHIKGIDVY